jgi:hypothetical protein
MSSASTPGSARVMENRKSTAQAYAGAVELPTDG